MLITDINKIPSGITLGVVFTILFIYVIAPILLPEKKAKENPK